MKPKPKFWIPANADARKPRYWYNPDSLCRTCIYQFLQEPFCGFVRKKGKCGITNCDGYELEAESVILIDG